MPKNIKDKLNKAKEKIKGTAGKVKDKIKLEIEQKQLKSKRKKFLASIYIKDIGKKHKNDDIKAKVQLDIDRLCTGLKVAILGSKNKNLESLSSEVYGTTKDLIKTIEMKLNANSTDKAVLKVIRAVIKKLANLKNPSKNDFFNDPKMQDELKRIRKVFKGYESECTKTSLEDAKNEKEKIPILRKQFKFLTRNIGKEGDLTKDMQRLDKALSKMLGIKSCKEIKNEINKNYPEHLRGIAWLGYCLKSANNNANSFKNSLAQFLNNYSYPSDSHVLDDETFKKLRSKFNYKSKEQK